MKAKRCHVQAPVSFSNSVGSRRALQRQPQRSGFTNLTGGISGQMSVCWCQARWEESTPVQISRTGKACGAAVHWEGSKGRMGQFL